MRGDKYCDSFTIAENLQVIPEIDAGAGIESGRRLVKE
jgi:hypothetical protein